MRQRSIFRSIYRAKRRADAARRGLSPFPVPLLPLLFNSRKRVAPLYYRVLLNLRVDRYQHTVTNHRRYLCTHTVCDVTSHRASKLTLCGNPLLSTAPNEKLRRNLRSPPQPALRQYISQSRVQRSNLSTQSLSLSYALSFSRRN